MRSNNKGLFQKLTERFMFWLVDGSVGGFGKSIEEDAL